jgi:methylornithine synthase
VVDVCRELAASGVVLLDLTMGEDPEIHDDPGYRGLLELVEAVRREAGLPVMVSPGLVPHGTLPALAAAGADWYALYQETHSPGLYDTLRVGQPFAARRGAPPGRAAGRGRHAHRHRRRRP